MIQHHFEIIALSNTYVLHLDYEKYRIVKSGYYM